VILSSKYAPRHLSHVVFGISSERDGGLPSRTERGVATSMPANSTARNLVLRLGDPVIPHGPKHEQPNQTPLQHVVTSQSQLLQLVQKRNIILAIHAV
jgi:hypothetical protein